MTTEQIKTYLKAIVEVESSIYIQEDTRDELVHYRNSLCIKNSYSDPSRPTIYDTSIASIFDGEEIFYLIGTIVTIIVSILLFSSCNFGGKGFVCFLIICFIAIAYGHHIYEKVEDIRASKLRYQDELRRVAQMRANDEKRMQSERITKQHLDAEIELLQTRLGKTRALLNKLYSLNIIFAKYHNFVAVCSFYEYFLSGRCSKLEGHEGAYNIYETEIRLDMILTKLDDVIAHLSKIEQNQYTLYDAICKGNDSIKQLVSQTKSIASSASYSAKQSAIAAENSRWAAQELETLRMIETYKLYR